MEAETAAALKRLPRPGNGLGAKYRTREPKVCETRVDPKDRPPIRRVSTSSATRSGNSV